MPRCRRRARESIPATSRACDDSIRQHELGPRHRPRRELLPHRRRGVRGQHERLRGHHRARPRGPDDTGAVPAPYRARSRTHRRRSGRRTEAGDRGKRRARHDHQLGHPRHQGGRAGFAGDCRLEYAGADRDPQQLTSKRPARTSCSAAPTSTFQASSRATSPSRTTCMTKDLAWRGSCRGRSRTSSS